MCCGTIAANISLADRKAHFLVDIDVRLNSGIAKAKSWKRVPLRGIHQAMQRFAETLQRLAFISRIGSRRGIKLIIRRKNLGDKVAVCENVKCPRRIIVIAMRYLDSGNSTGGNDT